MDNSSSKWERRNGMKFGFSEHFPRSSIQQTAHLVNSRGLFIFQRIFVLSKESDGMCSRSKVFSTVSHCANHRLCHITPSQRDKKPDLLEPSANAGKLISKTSHGGKKSEFQIGKRDVHPFSGGVSPALVA